MLPRKSLAQQVLIARKRKGLKQEVLGRMIGCTGSYVTKIERGTTVPSPILAMKLEKALGLKKGSLSDILVRAKLKEAANRHILRSKDFALGDNTLVPLYVAACGKWSDIVVKHIAVPNHEVRGRKLFFMKAHDDSNDLLGIMKDDLLLCEEGTAEIGDLTLFCVGKDVHVKRYKAKKDGHHHMAPHSSNRLHKATRHPHDCTELQWKGIVLAIYLKKVL